MILINLWNIYNNYKDLIFVNIKEMKKIVFVFKDQRKINWLKFRKKRKYKRKHKIKIIRQ